MRGRIVRLGLGASLALAASAPLTAPADAWACIDTVGEVLCLVVGTSCRAVDSVTGLGELCTFG